MVTQLFGGFASRGKSNREYRRYKDIAKKAFQTTVAKIQAKNANTDEEEIRKDVNKTVEAVRLKRYGRGK